MKRAKPPGSAGAANRRALAASVLAGVIPLAGATSAAASFCLPHSDIVELLNLRFAEGRVSLGVDSRGALVEVFSTVDGATWTIVVTTPNGMSCVLASGKSWHNKGSVALDQKT